MTIKSDSLIPYGSDNVQDYLGYNKLDNVEVVSLNVENATVPGCLKYLRPFVTRTNSAVGTTLDDGLPVVCVHQACYVFDPSGEGWNFWRQNFWSENIESYYPNKIMAMAVNEFKREMFFSKLEIGANIVEWTGDGGKSFETTSFMPGERIFHCLAVVNNNPDAWIFATGGREDGLDAYLKSTLTYTQKSDEWIRRADLPTGREHLESIAKIGAFESFEGD